MPVVSEPFIVWITAGAAQTGERELGGTWVTTYIGLGSLFLTMAGAPCSFRWRRLSTEFLEVVLLLLSMPLFETALIDLYGSRAQESQFCNVSGIEGAKLVSLLPSSRGELAEPNASALFVRGMAHAIAIHVARLYVDVGTSTWQAQRFQSSRCGSLCFR